MPAALETVGDYVGDARTLLQDTVQPYRYDDPSLLVALNVTLLEARRLRADLFVFHRHSLEAFNAVDDKEVRIEPPFRLAILYGLIGHALQRDQEDVQDARATAFLKLFDDILTGVRQTGLAPAQGQPTA